MVSKNLLNNIFITQDAVGLKMNLAPVLNAEDMKLFLDDERMPEQAALYMQSRIGKLNPIYLEEWMVVKTYTQFTIAITKHHKEITHVSFDHDLSDFEHDREKTGHDCAVWLKNYYTENNLKLPIMFVHSANPIGVENIINVFK